MEWEYCDQTGSRGRKPHCLVVGKDGAVFLFTGKDIPGLAHVLGARPYQNGKWSSTTYQVVSGQGITPVIWRDDFESGKAFPQNTWGELFDWILSKAPQTDLRAFERYIREAAPKTAARLDENAAALAAAFEDGEGEEVIVAFGNPMNRLAREGFWEKPKSDPEHKVTIAPSPDGGWGKPIVVSPEGAVVLSSVHTSGPHDGYWQVRVRIP